MSLRTRLLHLFVSRYTIATLNLILVYFAGTILWDFLLHLHRGHLSVDEVERIFEGLAVLSISYGVALESRQDLMPIFRLYPDHDNPTDRRIDQVCHDFGIGILLGGLFMEIPVQAVTVPDHIFFTQGLEVRVLTLATPFIGAILLAAVLLTWRLFRLPDLRAEGHGAGAQ
jgi:hypothetical protein